MHIIFLLLLLLALRSEAATWYAASTGSSTNGTSDSPWGILYSVTNTNPYLLAGDTVIFKDGTYSCPEFQISAWNATNTVFFRKGGTGTDPITYQAEHLWCAKFDGSFTITNSNIRIKYVHVYCSGITPRFRSNDWQFCYGINCYGSNISILHNLVENTATPGIGAWNYGPYYLNGNVVRFNGQRDYDPASTASKRGNSFYIENNVTNTDMTLYGNISVWSYTHSLKPKNNLQGLDIRFNIVGPSFADGILIEPNNEPIMNVPIISNYVWAYIPGRESIALRPNYISGDNDKNASNVVVNNNYLVGGTKGLQVYHDFKEITITSNTIVNLGTWGDGANTNYATEYRVMYLEDVAQTNDPVYVIDWNVYYSPTNKFFYWGQHMDWTGWLTNNIDSNSSFTLGQPSVSTNFVFRPTDDSNFVHLAVFNWITNSTATVDLSGFFASGNSLKIYDVQNVPNVWSNVQYAGGSVLFDLTLTNRTEMLGVYPEYTNVWTGFDPRFRAFVIYRDENPILVKASLKGKSIFKGNATVK